MEFMTANWPPERNLRSSDRAAGNALEALQKPHPFRLMTGRFNLHACSNRTNVDRPALVLLQCKEFFSVSTRISSKCSLWNAQLMLDYRNSYRRTVAAALLASSLAAIAIAAIALLITPSTVFPLRLATELLSLVCLAIAVPRGSSRGWRDHCSPSRRGGTEGPAILFRPTTGMLPWYIDSPAAPVANVTSWLTGSIAAVAGGMGESPILRGNFGDTWTAKGG
jgi:hypothetical protein